MCVLHLEHILNDPRCGQLEAPSASCSSLFVTYLIIFGISPSFLAFEMFQTHLVPSLSQSWNWPFLSGTLVLFGSSGFKDQDMGTRCMHCSWGVFAKWSELGNRCMLVLDVSSSTHSY